MTESLGTALPKEMARVRGLIPLYAAIPTGGLAIVHMQMALGEAEQAMMAGDVAGMMAAHERLKGFKE